MNITERITKLVLARKPEIAPRGVKRAISNACGISYEAVRQWYAGDTGNIKNENLVAIAEKFDTTVDWLLSGDGEPPRRASADAAHASIARIAQAAPSVPESAGKPATTIEPVQRAAVLAALASPRSQEALERIAKAANEGRLTEADLILLEQIASKFESKGSEHQEPTSNVPRARGDEPNGNQRLREQLRNNDPGTRQ